MPASFSDPFESFASPEMRAERARNSARLDERLHQRADELRAAGEEKPRTSRTPTDGSNAASDDFERFCADPDARLAEFRRRVDSAIDAELDADAHARAFGIGEQRRHIIVEQERATFLDELRRFIRTHPDAQWVEPA
ncbi:hypothetical protein GOPIP_061_00170 [Gordonia polyisoprenivorans NBRC 16320 = JCM 10675]|uniref:hypothetical protein n=2 Tax=Gordonia polyisoprenivorans TaxID=84595 RepID=UPI00023A9E5D|nr:hypothetical protein [Gordonia polyisoprenivorans]OZC31479.1 hypothetical protein CJJ17_08340 [Gordonia polyisoprenivorans]GAB24010.1 hypothetical protein GOPIP_061_00170 [Gordonia polyisoprenivorans NBRC 16320 = JCM 10675]